MPSARIRELRRGIVQLKGTAGDIGITIPVLKKYKIPRIIRSVGSGTKFLFCSSHKGVAQHAAAVTQSKGSSTQSFDV